MLHVLTSASNLLSFACVFSHCLVVGHGLSPSTSLGVTSAANTTSTAPVEINTDSTLSLVTPTIQASSFLSFSSALSLSVAPSTSIVLAQNTSHLTTSPVLAVTTSDFSAIFSSTTFVVQTSTPISRNLSASSTGSSKSIANSTTSPILASTPSASSLKASESATSPILATPLSSPSVIVSSMTTPAHPPSIPDPITSKNNTPVVSLADQTPAMSSSKPSSSQQPVVSPSHTSSPVVSTKNASPPLSSTHSEPPPAPPSKPVDPPTSTSKASSTPIPPSTSSRSVQTTTSVVVVKAPLSQITSTVTQTADTTLSSAIALTSTNANGSKIVTTPALVTLMSTSTESDGALATVTHVVANPPNLGGTQQLSSDNGPLHKQGVLAGICVVVGILAATIVIGFIFCVRRRRRLDRRRRWLAGMQQQRPASSSTDPFRDPQETYRGPTMGSLGPIYDRHWDQGSGGSPLLTQEPLSHENRNIPGGISLVPDPYPAVHVTSTPDQARYEYPHVGLAYTTDLANPSAPFKRHSMTPSSPSIYPATLPPDDNERHEADDYIPEHVPKESTSPVSLSTVPPRPPRSHLRESAKIGRYGAPLTPPDSNSSHNSQPPSPISESNRPQEFLTRRTLLDVRNR